MRDGEIGKAVFSFDKKQVLKVGSFVAIIWSVFQLSPFVFGFFDLMIFRPTHIFLAVTLALILNKGAQKRRTGQEAISFGSWALIVLAFITLVYLLLSYPRLLGRIPYVDRLSTWDVIFGVAAFLLVLEASRRELGWIMPLLVMGFAFYAFAGEIFPGMSRHRGVSVENFVELLIYSTDGYFGIPTGVSADTVFYFVLFGAFLEVSGGADLFTDLSSKLLKGVKGGAAKLPVISSWFFGMISGSGAANVAVDGMITIPLMKKSGYSGEFAAAMEATASTGGQIMPPVMGAAAFVMASILGVKYREIAISGMIPGVLYYLGLYFIAHLISKRIGRTSLLEYKGENIRRNINYLAPLVLLVYLVIDGTTLFLATTYSIAVILIVSCFHKESIMGLGKILTALAAGAKGAVQVALACALAGGIGGILVYTGLSGKLTEILLQVSGGNAFLILLMAMVGCIILGMGVPTTAAYILTAVTFVPPIVASGIPPLNAHFFCFYFACLSLITPPVAIATYAAAAIAGSNMWKSGWTGFSFALSGLLIPYAFVYYSSLLAKGSLLFIILDVLIVTLAIYAMSITVAGYYYDVVNTYFRAIYAIGAILIIAPSRIVQGIGIAVVGGCLLIQYYQHKKVPKELGA